ncbi:FAD/NAD(P)-binding protein [Klebsiella pneumoniae]
MKRIAIVGVGPTGIYTFYELVKRGEPLAITLFEKEAQAGTPHGALALCHSAPA